MSAHVGLGTGYDQARALLRPPSASTGQTEASSAAWGRGRGVTGFFAGLWEDISGFFAGDEEQGAGQVDAPSGKQGDEHAGTCKTPPQSVYADQRDNDTTYTGAKHFEWDTLQDGEWNVADRMCNVTSIAMALSTMAGSVAAARALVAHVLEESYGDATYAQMDPATLAGNQLEDLVDLIVQHEYDVGARDHTREGHAVYEKVLDIFAGYDASNIEDARFLADWDEGLYKNAEKRLTKDVVADGKTVQQLLTEGHTFIIRSTIPGGGHISHLKEVRPDGIVVNDPYGVNVRGNSPTYANCMRNEVSPKDRSDNIALVKNLVGWSGDRISDSLEKRRELMQMVSTSAEVQRRFQFAPDSLAVLNNLGFYYFSQDAHDATAPLHNRFGEAVFYSWAECAALEIPSMLLDVVKKVRETG